MARSKGVDIILATWLQLASRLRDRCPHLWLVGGAPDEIAEIRSLIYDQSALDEAEATGRIRWWGHLDSFGLSTILLKAHVLVTHSLYEPGGRVVLEAMTHGVPVIATPHGFAADLIRDWVNGFLVSYGDLPLLMARMEHFARQPLLGCSLGLAAKATARSALTSWDFLGRHAAVYAATLGASDLPLVDAMQELVRNPLPAGIVGRYPFETDVVDERIARQFVARALGCAGSDVLLHRMVQPCRSTMWSARAGEADFVVKHPYTTFSRRQLWDHECRSELVHTSSERFQAETLATSLSAFVSAIATDSATRLLLFPGLKEPASTTSFTDRFDLAREGLEPLWQATITPSALVEPLCVLDRDWSTEELGELQNAGATLRRERDVVQLVKPNRSSLRFAWRELTLKIRLGAIRADPIAEQLLALEAAGHTFARSEAGTAPCFHHGDFNLGHVKVDQGNMLRLVDGELLTVGWWGRDAATILLEAVDEADSDDSVLTSWRKGLDAIAQDGSRTGRVATWMMIEAANDLARRTSLTPFASPQWLLRRCDLASSLLREMAASL